MVRITSVTPKSRAERHGILAGDTLISINGREVTDVLDYRFFLTATEVKLALTRDGEAFEVTIRKREYDDIGLDFETPLMDKKHSCENKCIFCFIDQLPKGMRETLYFKDDDSRLSFLHGNFITMTNLRDHDIDRIIEMHISPVNISVHTTNPELRVKMMHNKRAGLVLDYLPRLAEAGITLCGQLVLCRGINDGAHLDRTLHDLMEYLPALDSVSIVPAGLTKFRDGLYPLTDFSKDEAAAVIDMIEFDDYKVKINGLQPTLVTLGGALKLEAAKKEIAELEKVSFSVPWSENGLRAELSNENAHFLTAVSYSKVLGYIGIHEICGEAYITNVAVFPEYRRLGIGETLIDSATIGAKQRNCEFISLEVRISNTPAIELYKKEGYNIVGQRKNFYSNPTEDAYIMTRVLKDCETE